MMPSKNGYLALVIIGFILGVLWGALSIGPYNDMKQAIEVGNVDEARKNAKKIRTFFIIGLVVNVLIVLGQVAAASSTSI